MSSGKPGANEAIVIGARQKGARGAIAIVIVQAGQTGWIGEADPLVRLQAPQR